MSTCRLVLLALLLPALLVPAAVSASPPEGVRVIRSDAQGVRVEVSSPSPVASEGDGGAVWTAPSALAGWQQLRETGQPDLPFGAFEIGLPPGTRPVLVVRAASSRLVAGPEPRGVPRVIIRSGTDGLPVQIEEPARDAEAFAAEFPRVWAELGEVGWLRHVRTVSVQLYPYHWDPASGALRWADRLEVEVRFEPQPEKSGAAPGEEGLGRGRAPGREDDTWDRTYRRGLLNGEEAVRWRRAPAIWSRTVGRHARKSLQEDREFRLTVRASDFYRVTHARLAAEGWNPVPIPIDRLALQERFFDDADTLDPFHEQEVPIQVRDLDGDGQFGPGDDFLFFGLTAWDRLRPAPEVKRYGRVHAYYLGVRDGGGARFTTAPSWLDGTDVPVNTEAYWTQHYEENRTYMRAGITGRITPEPIWDFDRARGAILGDHSSWFGNEAGTHAQTFVLSGLVEPLELRMALQRESQTEDGQAFLSISLASLPDGQYVTLADTVLSQRDRALLVRGREALAAAGLQNRNVSLRLTLPTANRAAVDWVEWYWRRDLRADARGTGRRLAFHTGSLAGVQEFHLRSFPDSSLTGPNRILVFDISDSARTQSSVGPVLLTWDASQYANQALRVRLDLGGGGQPRRIFALTPGAATELRGADIEALQNGPENDLTLPPAEGAEELIAIVHSDSLGDEDFVDGIEPLLAARRAQGLVVRKVRTFEVYDQFNGGRASPVAIRNYLRYLFRARVSPPSFLLLVGDASVVYQSQVPLADVDYVPTPTVFSDSYSDQSQELVECDYWYVDRLTDLGETFDYRPDMHLGRLPAGSAAELATLVDKILDYGVVDPSDAWRARGLFVSDDTFSSTIGFTAAYRYQASEPAFRWAAQQNRRIIRELAGFQEFACDTFFTAVYMDTVNGHWSVQDGGRSWPVDLQRCRDQVRCDAVCSDPAYPAPDSVGMFACLNSNDAPYQELSHAAPYNLWWTEDNYYYGRERVGPLLRQSMGQGHLFVCYQGHANARLMSHEYILSAFPGIPGADVVDFLSNEGKPFFYLGFGCHLLQFAAEDERNTGRRDSMVERMLFLDRGRGAVAALASSGYEWINTTERLNKRIMEAWFLDPPRDNEGDPRWLLGEIITRGRSMLASDPGGRAQIPTYGLLGDPSMPMEMAPPRLAAYVNCRPGDEGCVPWSGGSLQAEAESDTARVRVVLADESGIRSVVLHDETGEVDPSGYRIEPDESRPEGMGRVLVYNRRLTVPEEDFTLLIEAEDGRGRRRELLLPVEFAAAFSVLRHGSAVPISPGDVLELGDTVRVVVGFPVDVPADRITLALDDEPIPLLLEEGGGPRGRALSAELPSLGEGAHELAVRVERGDGSTAERSASFRGPGLGMELQEAYTFPNPFTEETRFIYRLNHSGLSARVSVFTLSGRKIWSAEAPARANDNEIVWDGRDRDGDPVANGVYLYKLEVRTAAGKTIERIDRVARIR